MLGYTIGKKLCASISPDNVVRWFIPGGAHGVQKVEEMDVKVLREILRSRDTVRFFEYLEMVE